MDKTYQPDAIERRWYQHWEKAGYFAPQGDGKPYCIMIPPPNVTGSLHMGHGFNNAVMDTLIRYHRMKGQRQKQHETESVDRTDWSACSHDYSAASCSSRQSNNCPAMFSP